MEGVINSIRNILRKEGITGMESINHCIVFILSRLLTDELCEKIGMEKKYSFKSMMKNDEGEEIQPQELKAKFYSKVGANHFIHQIVNKLGFKNIKFKLESPIHLMEIFKELCKLDITKLSNKYDIIGTIYELHLKSGTSNAMRDLGQYYTHRLAINFMIKLCEPVLKKNGSIEKIVDPTMGTGGFLTMSVKYLNDKYKNKIDWSKNKNNLYGFDIDDNVKNMALLNLLLEMGELCKDTIAKQDTLHNDMKLPNDTIFEKADVILANEPMGLKNITHASCCERIKELKMRGTKAEPLFLQLFMQSLADKGRCAVIIPDGVLFNDSNLHNDTRKYLVENFNLKKIIALNDDFFLNTGVKTSILYFVKDGKTKEVEFSELKIKGEDVEETSVIKVKYDDIVKNKYSLFVNKYNAIEIEKIEGIVYKKLGELIIENNSGEVISKDYWNIGDKILYSCCQNYMMTNYSKFPEKKLTKEGDLLLPRNGSGIPYVKIPLINSLYTNVVQRIVLDKKICNYKYVYYAVNSNIEQIIKKVNIGTIPSYNFDLWKSFEIPIPSLIIQNAIVEKLDVLHSNIENSKKIAEEYRKILKYYVESQTKHEKKDKINNICRLKGGKRIPKGSTYSETKTNYYYLQVTDFNYMNDENYKNISKSIFDSLINYKLDNNDLLISIAGTIGNIAIYSSNKNCILTENACKFVNIDNKILLKYLYYYLKSEFVQTQIKFKIKTATIPKLSLENIKDITIKIPSLKKQQEIVNYCDEMSNTINFIEKQIENNETLMKEIMDMYLKNSETLEKEILENPEPKEEEETEEVEKTEEWEEAEDENNYEYVDIKGVEYINLDSKIYTIKDNGPNELFGFLTPEGKFKYAKNDEIIVKARKQKTIEELDAELGI